jgi:transposase
VINVGTLSKLRRMVRRDGLSVREASKKLGIARNTAARWLAMDEMVEPKYPKRVPVESILDPYKEQLINWLKADSHRGKRDRRTTKAPMARSNSPTLGHPKFPQAGPVRL